MAAARAEHLIREVQHLLADHALASWSDSRLLERYVTSRDGTAFAALVQRHGPLVWRVCRGLVANTQDAEDAFQATFLVLACSAAKVRKLASVGCFLYGTACRVAARVRAREARRQAAEREATQMRSETEAAERGKDTLEIPLHEELARLPERYRQVLVLCHLEGRTHEQVARELGCPVGSVSRHLRRATELLRDRLAGRGVVLSAGLLLPALASGSVVVPPALAQATLQVVASCVEGTALAGGPSLPAVLLAKEVLHMMGMVQLKALTAVVLLLGLIAGTALFAQPEPAPIEKPAPAAPRAIGQPPAQPVTSAEPALVDRQGDPLPPEAVARLGTARLRHGGEVLALAFSRDGQALLSAGHDQTLRLWQVPSGKQVACVPKHQTYINAVALSADGQTVATVSEDGAITLSAVQPTPLGPNKPAAIGPERLRFKPAAGIVCFLAFLPDGNLVSGANDGRIYLWEPATGKELRRFGTPLEKEPHTFALSPDGKVLAVGRRDSNAVLWDLTRGESLGVLPGHTKVYSLAFAPDGSTLAVGDASNTIRLWDLKGRRVTSRLVGVKAPHQPGGLGDALYSLAYTPDGKTLLSVGDYGDGTIRVWDVATGQERRRLQGQQGDGRLLALSPDGKTLAVTGANNTVRLWEVTTGKELDDNLGSQGAVRAVAVAPDGQQVALAGSDGVIRLWDRATGRQVRSFRAHRKQIAALSYSRDGTRLVSSGAYDDARLWDVTTGKEIRSFEGAVGNVRGVAYACCSPDGKKIALATYEPSIQLLDAATGKVEQTVARGLIDRLAFSPDGRLLAGGGFDRRLHVWDLTTGKETWSAATGQSVASVAFAQDGQLIAAGTYGNQIIVWESATGQEVRRLAGPMRSVAISPDGRLLAAGGDTTLVSLYELATGQLVRQFHGHGGFVWSLTFAPNGRSLVSGSWDATALVWDLTGQTLARKQREPLTPGELESRWTALGSASAGEAYQAILSLANAPQQVAFLQKRLLGGAPPDGKAVAKWLLELDDDVFEVREAASRELARLGKSVEAELRRALAAPPSAESRQRLRELLDKLGGDGVDERLRGLRTVAVLELAATPEARELLDELTKKASGEDLRRQARAAFQRLAKRP